MRASARATWSMMKTSIEGIEDEVKAMKSAFEAEMAWARK